MLQPGAGKSRAPLPRLLSCRVSSRAGSFGLMTRYSEVVPIQKSRWGLCQEDEKSSCCTKDEGGPFEAAL
jgi:hypothetical protein